MDWPAGVKLYDTEKKLKHYTTHVEQGEILTPAHLTNTPAWGKPIVASAIKLRQE
ncbi:MAG: hypothetical protein NPIRA04_24850 [Nitrospirales bacterium]|nr:MAG: hypothetical protein NPIRA04_24850 [Nitrospirales bacterium]